MFKHISFVLIISMTCSTQPYAQAGDQQMDIMMKMQGLKTALIGKDSIGLSALLSDDVSYGHSNGLVQTKSQLIRSVMSGEQDYKSIEPSGMEIRFYDHTGIVTMQSKVAMIYNGKPLDLDMKLLLVWIKKGGVWKLVARQSAGIAK